MTVRELITKLGFQVNEGDLKKAEGKTKKFMKGLAVAGAAVATGIALIGKKAIEAAADMEMLTTQFEVMLGSTEAANDMMAELKKFSASTPFALEDLAKGSQQLLSFGVSQDKVIDTMRMLGDTAGGNAEKLNGLVLAYGKVSTKGKASLEELNMMAERGLPIFDTLAEQLNVTKEEMFKMVSKGQISAENVEAAFASMTGAGGMFFEGMKKQSETLKGIISTMKDNFTLLLADVGTAFIPVMKELNKMLIELAQGPLRDLAVALTGSLVPILELIMKLLEPLIAALLPVIDGLTAALIPLVEILAMLLLPIIEYLMPLFELLGKLLEVIGKILKALMPIFQMVADLITALTPLFEKLIGVIMQVIDILIEAFIPIIEALYPIFQVLVEVLISLMPLIDALLELFIAFLPLIQLFAMLIGALAQLFADVLLDAITAVMPLLQFVIKGITLIVKGFTWLVKKVLSLLPKRFRPDSGESPGDSPLGDLNKPIKVQMPPMSGTAGLKSGITKNTKSSNVSMTNNISVSGGVSNPAQTKQTMEKVAESVFTVQLKKVLVNSEI